MVAKSLVLLHNCIDELKCATGEDSVSEEKQPNQQSGSAETSQSEAVESAGKPLSTKAKETEMLTLPEGFEPKPMPERTPSPNTARLSVGWRIIFRIGDQKIPLEIGDTLVVGRGIEESPGDVDLDLTPHGAYHFGVSRRHAIMTLKDGYLYLEDLGSTNGTRINGFQLTANQKYRLRDGDEVEFARLRTNIRFRNPDMP